MTQGGRGEYFNANDLMKVLILVTIAFAGCSSTGESPAIERPAAVRGTAPAAFTAACADCHGATGDTLQGRIGRYSRAGFEAYVRGEGRNTSMPAFSRRDLGDPDLETIYEYLAKLVPPS